MGTFVVPDDCDVSFAAVFDLVHLGGDILDKWARLVVPRPYPIVHQDVMGAIEGTEALDIAWDAQAFLEIALLKNEAAALVSYDF